MRLLLLGSDNALAEALLRQANREAIDFACLPTSAQEVSEKQLIASLDKERPNAILSLAHYFDGFQSEDTQALPAYERLSTYLADTCATRDITLLQPSRYIVFDGTRTTAYDEQEALAPLALHGQCFARIEQQVRTVCPKHVLLRFGWLLDESLGGYVDRLLRQVEQGGEIPTADDRRGSPTTVDDAARVLLAIIKQLDCGAPLWGTYHYGGHEASTALALYQAILDEAKVFRPTLSAKLLGIPHELCADNQKEPQHAVLACKKILTTFGIKPRAWRVGLADVLERYFKQI